MRDQRAVRARLGTVSLFVCLCVVSVYFVFPVYWMISLSFRPATEFLTEHPSLFTTRLTLEHYIAVLNGGYFLYLSNSLIVSAATVMLCLVLSSMAGYGLTRFAFRGRKALGTGVFLIRMVPGLVYIIPMYMIFRFVGLTDTLRGLVLAYCSGSLPLSIWLFMGFYEEIPSTIYEAGLIDGCSEYQLFRLIAFPLVASSIAVVAILTFLGASGRMERVHAGADADVQEPDKDAAYRHRADV